MPARRHGLRTCLAFFVALPLQAAEPTLLVFGDSLSAGYGIDMRQAWPELLQQRLQAQGYRHRVVNASISGETTAGGRNRLTGELKQHRPAIVILELGANDGLRGLPLLAAEKNLGAMIEESQRAGAKVLLAGIRLPPNYGAYGERLFEMYGKLARRHKTALLPFLLDGVGGESTLMQTDGLHPRADAQPRILENVWPLLAPLLKS